MVSYPNQTTNLSNTGTITNAGELLEEPATSTAVAIGINVAGTDTFDRMRVDGTGAITWGPGTGARDTKLYRNGVGLLQTDTAFTAVGNINGQDVAAAGSLIGSGGNGLKLNNGAQPLTPSGAATLYASGGGLFLLDPNGLVLPVLSGPDVGGVPTGVLTSTAHAFDASGTASPASGTLYIQRVFLPAGLTISKLGFVTGLTAASGPTHWWTALLDNTYKQLAHSADQLTGAIAASTWQNLSLTAPFVTTYSGAYFLAVMIATSTTQPTLVSTTTVPNAALISGSGLLGPVPGGTSTTGLTAPGTDGTTTYATPTAASNFFYLYAS